MSIDAMLREELFKAKQYNKDKKNAKQFPLISPLNFYIIS